MKILFLSCYALLIFGCSQYSFYGHSFEKAKAAFDTQDWDNSVRECVNSLILNPHYKKAQKLIKISLKKSIKHHHKRIINFETQKKPFYSDDIINELNILIELTESIKTLNHPSSSYWLTISNSRDYKTELLLETKKAAESHYKAGLDQMSIRNYQNQQIAHRHFVLASSFIENYKNTTELIAKTNYSSILHLAILPCILPESDYFHSTISEDMVSYIISNFDKKPKLIQYLEIVDEEKVNTLLKTQHNEYNEDSAIQIAKLLSADHLIIGQINQLYTSGNQFSDTKKRFSSETIVGYETNQDENGISQIQNITGTAQAEVTIYNQSHLAKASAEIKIIDVHSQLVLKTINESSEYKYEYKWGTFIGNENVLNHQAKQLVKRKEEVPPTKRDMINRVIQDLSKKISQQLINTYRTKE